MALPSLNIHIRWKRALPFWGGMLCLVMFSGKMNKIYHLNHFKCTLERHWLHSHCCSRHHILLQNSPISPISVSMKPTVPSSPPVPCHHLNPLSTAGPCQSTSCLNLATPGTSHHWLIEHSSFCDWWGDIFLIFIIWLRCGLNTNQVLLLFLKPH